MFISKIIDNLERIMKRAGDIPCKVLHDDGEIADIFKIVEMKNNDDNTSEVWLIDDYKDLK